MPIRSISQLKSWFRKGMYPTESQFGDWLDSFLHREDRIPIGSVDGLNEAINSKAEQSAIDTLSQNISAISTKADGADSVASSALNDAKKALSDVATAQATAQQAIADAAAAITALRNGVAPEGDTLAKLYAKIQTLNATVTSNDVNLDTVQEIVTFIKNNRDVIDSISTSKISITNIVDNLLSSDINRPLSANQGKILKDLLDALATSLSNKVDKVNGKQLSTEDFTAEEKQKLAQQSGVNTGDQDLSGLQPKSQKNQANGYAGLDDAGKVPTALLPSYVDDVMEAANFSNLPSIGESGKIYITTNDNKQYRWSGSAYVNIATSPGTTDAVTEGATNLYFTESRVRNVLLTGISFAVNTAITATDSFLGALGKLQSQIAALSTGKVDKNGTDSLMTAAEHTKLGGISEGANNYAHPLTHPASMIEQDSMRQFVSSEEKAAYAAKLDKSLTKDKIWVGNNIGSPSEVDMIPYVDPSIPYDGQIDPSPFGIRMNTGSNTVGYIHSIARSSNIGTLNNGITQLFAPISGKKIYIKDVLVLYIGYGGSTVETTTPNIMLSANSDGSSPFANLNYTWTTVQYDVKIASVITPVVSLANGVFLNITGRTGGDRYSTIQVLINAIYV